MTDAGGGLPSAELGALARDGSRIRLTQVRRWSVSRAELWGYLTEPERLAGWLGLPDAPLTAPGGRRIAVGPSTVVGAEVWEVTPGERLRMRWLAPGEEPAEIAFELAEGDAATVLSFAYVAEDEDQVRSAVGGWFGLLDALGDQIGAPTGEAGGSPATRAIVRLAAAVELGRRLPF